MPTLKYPKDLDTRYNDFVQFTHFPYRVNDATNGNRGHLGTADAPPRPNIIQMYMPNTTPGVQQVQMWKGQSFPGAKGQLMKQLLDMAGGAGAAGRSAGEMSQADLGEVGKQVVLEQIAERLGSDAATALQLGKGQVYNPNIEMLYQMPMLRRFTFGFDFIPKNQEDTRAADRIIREFKYWSAPGIEGTNFLTVPDLWLVKYFNARNNKVTQHSRMNPWKPAIIEAVITQDNPLSDLHATISDPEGDVPVHTKMVLNFQETDIITRRDHDKSAPMFPFGGEMRPGKGYKRGY